MSAFYGEVLSQIGVKRQNLWLQFQLLPNYLEMGENIYIEKADVCMGECVCGYMCAYERGEREIKKSICLFNKL